MQQSAFPFYVAKKLVNDVLPSKKVRELRSHTFPFNLSTAVSSLSYYLYAVINELYIINYIRTVAYPGGKSRTSGVTWGFQAGDSHATPYF